MIFDRLTRLIRQAEDSGKLVAPLPESAFTVSARDRRMLSLTSFMGDWNPFGLIGGMLILAVGFREFLLIFHAWAMWPVRHRHGGGWWPGLYRWGWSWW